jgi:hypothetical protein
MGKAMPLEAGVDHDPAGDRRKAQGQFDARVAADRNENSGAPNRLTRIGRLGRSISRLAAFISRPCARAESH